MPAPKSDQPPGFRRGVGLSDMTQAFVRVRSGSDLQRGERFVTEALAVGIPMGAADFARLCSEP
jgi:hypothetical protein